MYIGTLDIVCMYNHDNVTINLCILRDQYPPFLSPVLSSFVFCEIRMYVVVHVIAQIKPICPMFCFISFCVSGDHRHHEGARGRASSA